MCYFILPVDCLVIFFISEFSIYIFTNALNNHGKIYVYNLYMGVKVVLFYRGKSKHNWSTVFHFLIKTIFLRARRGGGVTAFPNWLPPHYHIFVMRVTLSRIWNQMNTRIWKCSNSGLIVKKSGHSWSHLYPSYVCPLVVFSRL